MTLAVFWMSPSLKSVAVKMGVAPPVMTWSAVGSNGEPANWAVVLALFT